MTLEEEDPYEADTDIDDEDIKTTNKENDSDNLKIKSKFPPLPNYFDGKTFFIFGPFSSQEVRKSINR